MNEHLTYNPRYDEELDLDLLYYLNLVRLYCGLTDDYFFIKKEGNNHLIYYDNKLDSDFYTKNEEMLKAYLLGLCTTIS